MSGNLYRKPVSGQPFRPSAAQFGMFIDAARKIPELQRIVQRGQANTRDTNRLLLVNDTGAALDEFSVLEVGEPLIDVAENLQQFQNRPIHLGDVPESETAAIGILLQPTDVDRPGEALLSGVVAVQILQVDPTLRFARATPNETGYLTASATGPARILWREAGEGPQWGLVQLGLPSAPSGQTVICQPIDACQPDEGSETVFPTEPCDCARCVVITAPCGSALQPGDEINVWDPGRCWFNLPPDLLFNSRVFATQMQNYLFREDDPYSDSRDDCIWIASHICCAEG